MSLNFSAEYLPPANEVWGKVMFLHLPVILFTGGGGVLHAFRGLGRSPPLRALRDMVNKRSVRILLECILVVQMFILIYWFDFSQNVLEKSSSAVSS